MRPQFSVKTLLWLMAVVAAFLAGLDLGHKLAWKDAIRHVYLEDVEAVATMHRMMNEPPQDTIRLRFLPAEVPPISA